MQGSLVRRKVSVHLSVKCVHYDKTEERSVHIFIPYERSFSLVFWKEECLVGGDSFYLKFWVIWPHWSEITDFEPIFAHSTSAVTPIKNLKTNRKSTLRFPVSLRWPSYVPLSPSKGAQKCKTAVFGVKSHFTWRKSATKFLLRKLSGTKL